MRADRLIALLMILQNRNGATANALAAELEVSERTIYRDLSALSAAGIPVYTQSGPGGGCFLVEDYRTDLTGMTSDQARALFMLSIPAPLDQLGFSQDLKAAFLKLSAALPSTLRNDETQTRQRLYLDWGFDLSLDGRTPHLKIVQQAVWEDRLLCLRYRSLYSPWIEPFEHTVAAYSLVAWAGEWYLVCFWEQLARVIRVRDIETSEILPAKFSRDPDFELSRFWQEWRRQYQSNRPVFTARVRVAPQMAVNLPLIDAGAPDERGWVTASLQYDTFEAARARILSYGGSVEVLEPQALRCSVQDYADQICGVYREGSGILRAG